MTTTEKVELSAKIKENIIALNLLIQQANTIKLKVDIKQAFHPASNANGAPLNPYVNATLSETLSY